MNHNKKNTRNFSMILNIKILSLSFYNLSVAVSQETNYILYYMYISAYSFGFMNE